MAKKQEAKAPPKPAVTAEAKKKAAPKVPPPATKKAAAPRPVAPKPETELLKTGTQVKLKGDKRTWEIIGVNPNNYRIKFNHGLPGMEEEKNVPFGDVSPL